MQASPDRRPAVTRRELLRTLPAAAAFACSLRPGLALAAAGLPVAEARPEPPFSRFTDVAAAAGLTRSVVYGEASHATYIIESMGGGCAFFDYDNDGWMDIFILGGRHLDAMPAGSGNRLYRNNRNGTFTDVTEKSGLAEPGWACGVCVGDWNNDGYEDLFVTYFGQNRLYRNNGDGTFTDMTAKAGLLDGAAATTHPRFSTGCTFFDYNRDGLLDLFVANYVEFDTAHAPLPSLKVPNCNYEGVPVYCGPKGLGFPQHSLYRNNGDGSFTDVSASSGIAAMRGSYGLTAVAFDADDDGWPDLFVACDSTPSLLLMNNHDGTFREEGLVRGVALSGDGQELGGMGIALGDYNLDGRLDLVKTHFQQQATGLYRGEGKGEFVDVTIQAGLNAERRYISWGAGLVDFDNDGYPDLFVTTGTTNPELERAFPAKYRAHSPSLLFRSRHDGSFVELGAEAGPGIRAPHMTRGCAFGDFDNDGDMDILIMNMNEPPALLRNDAPLGNHWLKLRLEGTRCNRSAIGARVLVHHGGKTQAQEVLSQSSYLSSNDPRLHFGLGSASVADVEVRWPAGASESFANVAADQLVTIREAHGIVSRKLLR